MENNIMEITEVQVTGRRKKHVVVIAAIICVLALIATGTAAYFTAEETSYNVITTATLDMELVETTTGGEPWPEDEGITGVFPGMVVDKVVTIENKGGVSFYTRIFLEYKVIGADGKELPFEHITLDFNTDDWTEKDGFYYYNKALKPNLATEPLFETVTFEYTMGNEYQNCEVVITVNAQAVQSRNNTDSPLTAEGWSAM